MLKILAAALLLCSMSACGILQSERQLLVSTSHVLLPIGDSTRVQWAVIRQHGGPLSPSFYQYDNFDSPHRFQWRSSAPQIAEVDNRGMIYATALGETIITATSGDLTAPPLRVTVYDPAAGTDGQ